MGFCGSSARRGAYLFGRLPALPLACFSAPLPRRGRGRPRLFHARGSAPCIPSIKPLAALAEPEKQAPGGACPRRCRLTLPLWYPQGGLSFWSPADPAFCFPFCPLSPCPLPRRGRGRFKVIPCKGLRPLHPRGLNPGSTGTGRQTTRPAWGLFPALAARPAAVVPGGGVCFPCRFPPPPLVLILPPSPRPPSPTGKGAGG